jgi:crotonobetainyl-CoA hydratase
VSTSDGTGEPTVLTEVRGHVLLITLNRPSARNAMNVEMATALGAAIERLRTDDLLRAGVLGGAGPAFCAGQDLKALAAGEPLLPEGHEEWGFGGFVSHECAKPLVAAVHGFAFGGGLELALACDLIVAADDSRLGLPEVTRGLFAAGGGVPRILQQLPAKIGARMLLTGQPLSATEGVRWGLVNEVVPAGEVLATAIALAETIARNAPLAVQTTKRLANMLATESTWEKPAWDQINRDVATLFASADAAEGARAFAEKREPVWRGR